MLVVRAVVTVRIDCGSARLQPHAWRTGCPRDRLSDNARRQHARLQDLFSICGAVSAVNTSTGQVDHDVASIDLALPIAKGRAIPGNDAPWPNVGTTAQDDHVMTVSVKCARKNGPDLAGSAWNDDPHATFLVESTKRRRYSGRGIKHCS